jgi:protein SCO1/2
MNMPILQILVLLLLSCVSSAEELPDDSIYHIGSSWKDHDKNIINIDQLSGKIQLVGFMYTYCETSCPVILSTLNRIDKQLDEKTKAQVQFLLISLDPERDTPEILAQYMRDNNLRSSHWRLLNGSPDDVLELSALFGVRYKAMDMNGDIAHSNMVTVLDKKGRIHYQMKGLNEDLTRIAASVDELANTD